MKNSGFTLVELLAVIVILGVLALIVTISTGTTINSSKNKLSQIQIQKIEEAAKLYYLNEGVNEALYNLDENKTCVNVGYLTENDYLEESEIKNPKDNSKILGSVKIIYENKKYKYEYQDTECNYSDYFASVNAVCDLISDADKSNSVTPGDKYQCKVKEKMELGFENGYYFYVLSYNDKEGNITEDMDEAATLNLIMERNICEDGTVATAENKCTVAWMNQKDYELAGGTQWDSGNYDSYDYSYYGPVTAMNYTYQATKAWDNVPNIMVDYSDDNYYGGIKTIGSLTQILNYNNVAVTVNEAEEGYLNLKARLPLYSELSAAGCVVSSLYEGTCPTYLMGYLRDNALEKYSSLTHISGIEGYWTLNSCDRDIAFDVYYSGILSDYTFLGDDGSRGVRPVITLGI